MTLVTISDNEGDNKKKECQTLWRHNFCDTLFDFNSKIERRMECHETITRYMVVKRI